MQETRSSVRIRPLIASIGAGVLLYTVLAALGGFSLWSPNLASAAYAYQYQYLTVIKHVINNDGGTATADQWSIHVKLGASEVQGSPQPGNENGTTYVLDSGTYTVSETGGPDGYFFGGFSRDCDASGTVVLALGLGARTCKLTNNDTGARRTIGYWKNHLAELAPLLPVDLGNYTVATTAQAGDVFGAVNCGSSKSGDAAGCLAGQLLAAKLNIANGNSTCIQPTVDQADTLLMSIGYAGPSGTYSLTSSQRALAVMLANALDKYNNDKKTC